MGLGTLAAGFLGAAFAGAFFAAVAAFFFFSAAFTGEGRDFRPSRCAFPITALRLTPPSSSAIWLAVDPPSHIFWSVPMRSSVQLMSFSNSRFKFRHYPRQIPVWWQRGACHNARLPLTAK